MYGSHDTRWRNLSRHDERFEDQLFRQLRSAPWWLFSVGFHALLGLVLMNVAFAPATAPVSAAVRAVVVDDPIEDLADLVKPDIDDVPPDEDVPDPIDPPTVKDTPVSDHNETANEQPFMKSLGDLDMNSDGPFDGPSTNSVIGPGGGAGGSPWGPGGLKDLRAGGRGDRTRIDPIIDAGLEWLKNHQSPEGFWDCDGFAAQCKLSRCDGAGQALYDPGVTGLALLAFLGAGETHKHGSYQTTLQRGLRYLKQIQDPEGCFGPRTTTHFTYNHAIAALAMTEAYAMTGSPLFSRSAQSAIDFVHKTQNPYLAWRYGVRPGDNDTSVTGWMVMALKSARLAGLRVDDAAFDGARNWIEKVTEPEYGRAGYSARGTGPARPRDVMDRFPADRSESLTAVAVLSRIFLGEDPRRSEAIGKGTDLCLKTLPVWDEASGAIDMYYWYYGTLALFQVGGDAFKTWNAALEESVIDSQRGDGDEKGSWDPVGPWGRDGGRVYSTALMTMCMEVYYRYPKVFGAK